MAARRPRLPALAGLLVLALGAGPSAADDPAARVIFAIGESFARGDDGAERSLTRGDHVFPGDTLVNEEGRLQVRFTDGALLALDPGSELRVDDYRYSAERSGLRRSFLSLLQGAFRTVTGAIGKHRRNSYRVNTPLATIGIRGTSYRARLCAGNCVNPENRLVADGLYAAVEKGAIELTNPGGQLEVIEGGTAFVPTPTAAPRLVPPERHRWVRSTRPKRKKKRGAREQAVVRARPGPGKLVRSQPRVLDSTRSATVDPPPGPARGPLDGSRDGPSLLDPGGAMRAPGLPPGGVDMTTSIPEDLRLSPGALVNPSRPSAPARTNPLHGPVHIRPPLKLPGR